MPGKHGDLTCAIGASCPRLGRQARVATLSLARAMVAVVGGGRPPLGSPYATTVQSTKIWMTRQGLQIWQGVLVAATMYYYCQIPGSSVENQLFPLFFCIGIDTSLGRCNVIAFSITQCAVNNCAVPHAWLGENSGAGSLSPALGKTHTSRRFRWGSYFARSRHKNGAPKFPNTKPPLRTRTNPFAAPCIMAPQNNTKCRFPDCPAGAYEFPTTAELE